MNTATLVPTARFHIRSSAPRHTALTSTPGRMSYSRSVSPTLALARACAEATAAEDRFESSTLLFLGACGLAVMGGCAFHLERFLAHWDSFQSFVNALIS